MTTIWQVMGFENSHDMRTVTTNQYSNNHQKLTRQKKKAQAAQSTVQIEEISTSVSHLHW